MILWLWFGDLVIIIIIIGSVFLCAIMVTSGWLGFGDPVIIIIIIGSVFYVLSWWHRDLENFEALF